MKRSRPVPEFHPSGGSEHVGAAVAGGGDDAALCGEVVSDVLHGLALQQWEIAVNDHPAAWVERDPGVACGIQSRTRVGDDGGCSLIGPPGNGRIPGDDDEVEPGEPARGNYMVGRCPGEDGPLLRSQGACQPLLGDLEALERDDCDGVHGTGARLGVACTVAAVLRRTKIIATLGPASADPATISRMVGAGMDVARLNFSHGTHDSHSALIDAVRAAAAEHDRAVAILQDIQGPRIRVGSFPGGVVEIETGSEIRLVSGDGEGDASTVHVQDLDKVRLEAGAVVVMNDGLIRLEVVSTGDGDATARVVDGGLLSSQKGVAFPGTQLDLPAVTPKDEQDLSFGAEHGVDLVAASFVTTGADIERVKAIVGDVPVIAKIERLAAYENLDDILALADGAMVARGDLGVELGVAPLPRAQKDILARTNATSAISITATEMLESMTSSPRPTRAEVTDVANAVLDGTDAVMLSAETAAGRYPVRAVETMAAVCLEAEASPGYPEKTLASPDFEPSFASAIAAAAADAASILGLDMIVAFTESGSTARLVAKYRPAAQIVAFTPHEPTFNRLAMVWGVTPLRFPTLESTDEMIEEAGRRLLDRGMVEPGDSIAMAAGIPPNQQASTNLLKLHVVGAGSGGLSGSKV